MATERYRGRSTNRGDISEASPGPTIATHRPRRGHGRGGDRRGGRLGQRPDHPCHRGHPVPRHGGAALGGTRGADQPPADANPFAPGSVVPADLDESDPVLYQIAGRYFLFTSGIPGLPTINVPVTSATDFGTWAPIAEALADPAAVGRPRLYVGS